MKKILLIILAIALVTGCSNSNDNDSKDENEQNLKSEKKENVHEIGDTVQLNSYDYGFTYEVTLNSYEEKKEYNGKTIAEFMDEGSDNSGMGFAVLNVTIKNTSDQTFVPMEKLDPAYDISQPIGIIKEFSPKLDMDLKPNEEVNENLVYVMSEQDKNVNLVFEYMNDEEVRFDFK